MIFALGDLRPQIHESVFVAPSADIIGDVSIGAGSSVWFQCTLRGDVHHIRIGERSNIQDGSVIHVTSGKFPTQIGCDVTVGHKVLIHGATVMDHGFVGMGSILLDESIVEPFGMVAAGALLPPRFVVKSGWLALGAPAKLVREIKPEEREMIIQVTASYVRNAARYRAELRGCAAGR